ncbi:MAG: hypothetical protein GIW98_03675 [Candidatus Eremiobacteraeota bacterium]|nr:hypothetical protein [Candidatus Eremiobacteraeota bacterium]
MNLNGISDSVLAQGLIRVGKDGIESGDDGVIDAYFADGFVFHGPGGNMTLKDLKAL